MRSAGLRAERQRHLEVADRGARAGRRPAGRMGGIVWIAGQRLAAAGGELHGIGLAQDQRPGTAHHRHRRGVLAHPQTVVDRRVMRGGIVRGVDHVLDAERQAMQRTLWLRQLVQLACPADGVVRVDPQPGLYRGIARGDPGQAGANQFLAGELPIPDQCRRRRGGELRRFRRGDAGEVHLLSFRTRRCSGGECRLRPVTGFAFRRLARPAGAWSRPCVSRLRVGNCLVRRPRRFMDQNSRPFFSSPCTPFSPFTVCVTWKSTASEQNA